MFKSLPPTHARLPPTNPPPLLTQQPPPAPTTHLGQFVRCAIPPNNPDLHMHTLRLRTTILHASEIRVSPRAFVSPIPLGNSRTKTPPAALSAPRAAGTAASHPLLLASWVSTIWPEPSETHPSWMLPQNPLLKVL